MPEIGLNVNLPGIPVKLGLCQFSVKLKVVRKMPEKSRNTAKKGAVEAADKA